MTMRTRAAAIAALMTTAGITSAQSVPFVVFENGDGVDITGLRITLEVMDLGDQVKFILANESEIESRVSSIYFELTEFTTDNLANPIIETTEGTSYTDDRLAPRNPAGSIKHTDGGAWGGTLYGINPQTPQPNINGMSPGETVAVVFDLVNGATAAEVLDALNNAEDGFRVAMHIQSVGEFGASVWAVNPTPGTAALFGLGGLIACRRRRAA